MDDKIFDRLEEVDLKKTMETSYVNYAMSVIVARALPDARDGLKPVQRRILHAMNELNNGPDKPHRKCARIVGDTMGKYHPHGDSSIYGALVNLAQPWSTRYPLVDGHGNFGSVDGDGAAAMRYTEARLSKMSMEMLADIEKDTVDLIPNFDETESEPVVLPSRFPNLLVNGTTGIAVGMATNIPPHNMREVIDAVVKIIENKEEDKETPIEDVLQIVKGPDFPTGAMIIGTRGINQAYRTGRGKVRVRAVSNIEMLPNGKSRIIVTEIPYLVNKARLIEKIAELVKEKKVEGITDLRDESSREGMRIVIELRRDANPNIVLNRLYKHTQLQDTFGVINLALVDGEPKVMTLLDMLNVYLRHQEEVVTRRTKYDLNKAEERAHIVQGLLIALDNIDEVIKIVRGSKSVNEAKEQLIERFGLDDVQAQAIVDMRLRALTGLEREKLEKEYEDLMNKIKEFKEILGDEKILLNVIKKEIMVIRDKYGDDRKTSIGIDEEEDFVDEDLIADDPSIIAISKLGYIKRMTPDNFHAQHRGGKGVKAMQTVDEDYIEDLFMTTAHHHIMFFTNTGRAYRIKAYEIPESGRTSRGTPIINLIQLQPGEKVTAYVTLKELNDDRFLFMATKKGTVKKSRVCNFMNIKKSGLQAITLMDGDELIGVKTTTNHNDIMLVTRNGLSVRFNEKDVRAMGRQARGVIGMNVSDNDEVVAMQTCVPGGHMLFVTEKGYGKISPMDEFSAHHRGAKGVRCFKIMEKTGDVLGAKSVDKDSEIMMITDSGIVIRLSLSDINVHSRSASGIKLMDLKDDNIKIASVTKVKEYISKDQFEQELKEENEEVEADEDEEITTDELSSNDEFDEETDEENDVEKYQEEDMEDEQSEENESSSDNEEY